MAHDRHTDLHPSELEIIEDLLAKGFFGRATAPFKRLEIAMKRHAPEVWEEQRGDPIAWGKKYGFPIIEVDRGYEKVFRWQGAVSRGSVKFYHLERFPDQNPRDYIDELKKDFAIYLDTLYETEKDKYEEEKKRYPKLNQTHHFEWFVLYHVKGWTHQDVLNWESKTNGRHLSPGAVSQGIRAVADVLAANLREPAIGGRPKISD